MTSTMSPADDKIHPASVELIMEAAMRIAPVLLASPGELTQERMEWAVIESTSMARAMLKEVQRHCERSETWATIHTTTS